MLCVGPRFLSAVSAGFMRTSESQLLPFIGDMGRDSRDPLQDGEEGKVSLEGIVHLGPVESV